MGPAWSLKTHGSRLATKQAVPWRSTACRATSSRGLSRMEGAKPACSPRTAEGTRGRSRQSLAAPTLAQVTNLFGRLDHDRVSLISVALEAIHHGNFRRSHYCRRVLSLRF